MDRRETEEKKRENGQYIEAGDNPEKADVKAGADSPDSAEASVEEPPVPDDISPWRDIFLRPRATARWLVANETATGAQTLWLSFTAFFLVILFLTLNFYPAKFDRAWSKMQLVMLTPVVFLLSWGYFILESYLLGAFARVLGGQAEVSTMRVINAYTTVIPSVVFGLLSLGLSFLVSRDGLAAKAFENITMVWAMWISLASLSVAAGISAWRAMAAYLGSLMVWIIGVMLGVGLLKAFWPQLITVFQ
jgi:hypothetical protein